jgi:glutaredoxin
MMNKKMTKGIQENNFIKLFKILFIITLFFPIVIFGKAKELNIYLFYGDKCPHCAELEKFLEQYLDDNKNVILNKYEVWSNKENQEKYKEVQKILNDYSNGVPYLIIGNNVITGYDSEITPERIKNTITYYSNFDYKDKVGIYLGTTTEEEENLKEDGKKYEDAEVNIPILGKKKSKEVPILLSTILIGLVDGFNPCAMWILIFLISMLLGMKNVKRKWALGITFLLSSALVYFLFLISWLNLAVFLNNIILIRMGISIIAVFFGILTILKFFFVKEDDGCEVVDKSGRKKIINSIKKIIKEKSFILALFGIVVLAASVNVIELLCSLGLPVMFTQILTINEVSKTAQIIYSLIYVFFFLIDDIVVFTIAMKTLEIKAISNKFGKYSHLIGGIIMLIIGFLMIYKPEWLMFNF